jgi:hypothetical protein
MFESLQDVDTCGDKVAALRAAAPGPAVMTALRSIDPRSVSPGAQVDMLAAWEKAAAWVAAAQQEVLAALDGKPDEVLSADDWTREEVAAALHLSACTADRRLQVARMLVRRLPGVRRALEAGSVDYRKAAAIAEATENLDAAGALDVEARVLPKAPDQTLAELRRTLRRVVIAVDPRAAAEAHRQAIGERCVRMWPVEDGMAELYAKLPAEDAAVVMTALDAVAAGRAGCGSGGVSDNPPIEARRADALTRLAAATLSDPDLPTRHGRRPHIQVTVSAETLLGDGDEPGELAGYGPVTAETARRIAAEGMWRRLLLEPGNGRLLDYGRTTYRPPADLTEFLLARDRVCGFPGCNIPAARCDLDHTVPFGRGSTSAANMGALCRRHHRAKHEGGWRLTRHGDERCTWTSPAGHSYDSAPSYPASPDNPAPPDSPAVSGNPAAPAPAAEPPGGDATLGE